MAATNQKEATSLKQLFQGIVPEGTTIVVGTVVGLNPLQIRIENDDKLVVSGSVLLVPRNLTDWQTRVDISLAGGNIDSITYTGGAHAHDFELKDSHSGAVNGIIGGSAEGGADDAKAQSSKTSSHAHSLKTFIIEGALMTVYNALQMDETVYLLKFNDGKNYLVLDRAYM